MSELPLIDPTRVEEIDEHQKRDFDRGTFQSPVQTPKRKKGRPRKAVEFVKGAVNLALEQCRASKRKHDDSRSDSGAVRLKKQRLTLNLVQSTARKLVKCITHAQPGIETSLFLSGVQLSIKVQKEPSTARFKRRILSSDEPEEKRDDRFELANAVEEPVEPTASLSALDPLTPSSRKPPLFRQEPPMIFIGNERAGCVLDIYIDDRLVERQYQKQGECRICGAERTAFDDLEHHMQCHDGSSVARRVRGRSLRGRGRSCSSGAKKEK